MGESLGAWFKWAAFRFGDSQAGRSLDAAQTAYLMSRGPGHMKRRRVVQSRGACGGTLVAAAALIAAAALA